MNLSSGLIWGQLGLVAVLALGTTCWHFYRDRVAIRVRQRCTKESGGFGKTLVFHSPDNVPRNFVQYGYRSNLCGTICVYCWLVLPLAGYVVMMWGCYIAYVISDGIPFPPGVDYWKETFASPHASSWNGLMLPWCVWFTIVHISAGVASKFYTAMSAHSMLPCSNMEDATHLIVDEQVYVDPDDVADPDETQAEDSWISKKMARCTQRVKRAKARQVMKIQEDEDGTRHVEYTCVRYIYSEDSRSFVPIGLIEANPPEAHATLARGGLSNEAAAESLAACGSNSIHVHVPGILEALGSEFSDFTYIFNSIGSWAYVAYSTWNIGFVWLFMMLGSGLYRALFIVRPNQRKIAEMAAMKQNCIVLREGRWQKIDVSEIVLGDIVQVQDGNNAKLPCDGILLQGSLIVNESMLTGEPMPIAKAPVENSSNYRVTDKLNRAYAGTLALESTGPGEGKSILYCTNIGALTTRGQLVRMVLFPASVKFKYNDQLPIVYGLMSIYVAIIVIVLLTCSDIGSAVATYLTVLCTVAMALNPMLPVSMVMGQSVSAGRLDDPKGKYQIKCLQPGRIPIAGKISTMVFDKTGTITKGGMDFAGVYGVSGGRFSDKVQFDDMDPESEENRTIIDTPTVVPPVLRRGLATCHTVKQLGSTGALVGNQVECAMVRTVGWNLGKQQMTSPQGEVLRIVRELEFDHHSMTSGAVVRDGNQRLEVFIKGSYEKIKSLALPQTVPPNYDQITMQCAKQNYYTLGISNKDLGPMSDEQVRNLPRELLERDVSICGLLLFRNEMKADSPDAIESLKEGSVRSVICTGDNELTGIAIGRLCGIVTSSICLRGTMENGKLVWNDPDNEGRSVSPEFPDPHCQLALTCSAWRYLHQEKKQLEGLWPRCVVFARMKPDDKINVVKYLQGRGLVVGMAGDGGNDCGGLRAAHAGLALSDAEASMVAPFSTGRLGTGAAKHDISLTTVPDLIREGRSCLSRNMATFTYFMVYAFLLTALRTFYIVFLNLSLGEWVWMTNDIGIGVIMMFFMTQSWARPTLAKYRPTATLLGFRTVSGVLVPYGLGCILLAVLTVILHHTAWYDPLNPSWIHVLPKDWMKKGDNYDSAIGVLILFIVLSTTAYVNTYGGDFRRNICRNCGINVMYALFLFLVFWMTLSNPNELNCIYRVNCDTEKSLACKNIPVLSTFSVGGTGGCFLSAQLKYWQNVTNSLADCEPSDPDHPDWLPEPENHCLPPAATLAKIPLKSTIISTGKGFRLSKECIGPNNCYSWSFKWIVAVCLLIYVAIHHGFLQLVLLGPVARALRVRQREEDKRLLDDGQSSDASSDGSDSADQA